MKVPANEWAALRVGVGDIFGEVRVGLLGVLGAPQRDCAFVVGHALKDEREGLAGLGEGTGDLPVLVGKGAAEGCADHRHRHGDGVAGHGCLRDLDLRVALVDGEQRGAQHAFGLGDDEAQAELGGADVQGAHPGSDEAGGVWFG